MSAEEFPLGADLFNTLTDCQDWLSEAVKTKHGAICPCCQRFDKEYKRKITSSMVRTIYQLAMLDAECSQAYHYSSFSVINGRYIGDYAKLTAIGLLEAGTNDNAKKKASGFYHITQAGRDFCIGTVAIPNTLVFYHDALVRTEGGVKFISDFFDDFDYHELMNS